MKRPPQFLFVHVNKRCNLRCQHCAFWELDDKDKANYLPWERKRDILGEFAEMSPGASVVICGGESMLDLEDYFAISKECKRLGLRSLSVINGTRVQRSEMADRMINEGPDEVSISLNSHVEALHDSTRGVTGAFRKAVNALRLLLAARQRNPARGNRIYAMGLIFDENYLSLDAFYDFVMNDIKADKLKLNFLQPSFGNTRPLDEFFRTHHFVDPELLVSVIRQCDEKYQLNINPSWLAHVHMYFQSLNSSPLLHLGWRAPTGTREHICNSYERNIMVDHYGVARLCFATSFPGMRLKQRGDLRLFWEGSDAIRSQMAQCNRYCGISHSVRRENCTLKPVKPEAPARRIMASA